MRTIRLFLLVLFLVSIDQCAKLWAVWYLGSGPLELTPFLDLRLLWNRGVSYGFLSSQESVLVTVLLVAGNVVVSFVLSSVCLRTSSSWKAFSLGMIVAGSIGNTCDRVLRGSVVDFISFHVHSFYWYVFNFADVWISLGACAYFFGFRSGGKKFGGRPSSVSLAPSIKKEKDRLGSYSP